MRRYRYLIAVMLICLAPVLGYGAAKIVDLPLQSTTTERTGNLTAPVVTRTSDAITVTDGVATRVRGSGVNLAYYSDNISNAAWQKSACTASGTNGLVATAVESPHFIYQSITPTVTIGKTYILSAKIKPGNKTWARLRYRDNVSDSTAYFNLSTGAISTTTNLITSGCGDVDSDGYRLCYIVGKADGATSDYLYVYGADKDDDLTWTGNGSTVSIYVKNIQFEEIAYDTSVIDDETGYDYTIGGFGSSAWLDSEDSGVADIADYAGTKFLVKVCDSAGKCAYGYIGEARTGYGNTFVFEVTTSGDAETFTLPLEAGGSYNFNIVWGDSSNDDITVWNQAETTHTYAVAGTYECVVTGTLTGWTFNNGGDKLKFTKIKNWGPFRLGNSGGNFYGCANLVITATDTLNLTGTTTLHDTFHGCTLANPDVANWNVSAVTNFDELFRDATTANPDVSRWNMSSAVQLDEMFKGATSANPDVSNWDVSNATEFDEMFSGATAANPDVSNWDVSSATLMNDMFRGATSANPNVASWNVSSVTNMSAMFRDATSANPNVASWNVGSVTNMSDMFKNATSANPNVASWNVSSVTNMAEMFRGATSANPVMSGWNVSGVTTMYYMFQGASSANPDVSSWNVINVTNMTSMFSGSAFSDANYDLLLTAWDDLGLESLVTFHAGSAKYGAGAPATARAYIISTFTWSITDGGPQ